jgi:hypothetical protein
MKPYTICLMTVVLSMIYLIPKAVAINSGLV